MENSRMNMKLKGTVIGVLYSLMCALGGGVGIATLIANPFDTLVSAFVGITFILSAVICWMWACFVRELYK